MLSSTYQTLLVILPLLISTTHSLPDNVFNKREAFGGGPPQQHGHPGGQCAGGWQECMSSMCAAGFAGPSATGVVSPPDPEATGAGASVCTATDGSCGPATTAALGDGSKRRRQEQTGLPATGAPAATGQPGPGGHMHGMHKNFADICSGFSDFMQQTGGPMATGPPVVATGVATGTGPVQS